MSERWIFGDESGNMDFSTKGTRWFLVGTMTCDLDACANVRKALTELRTRIAASGEDHPGVFHASKDRQAIRDQVFEALIGQPLQFDVTALDKPKTQPHIRTTDPGFYQYAWYYHLKHLIPRVCGKGDLLHVVLADIGTKAERQAFRSALERVMSQCVPKGVRYDFAFWRNAAEECLQATDYLLWAVFRYWERGDRRSYEVIPHLVKSEFDLFNRGQTRYY